MSAKTSGSDADCYLNHLARENVMRMGMEGGCDSSRQQIVYPDDSSKMYMPRGTLLYRCNDQSGCCPQKEHSCQPTMEEELRVAFYAIDCNGGDSRPTPEYVMMKNHTKCSCQPKIDSSQGFEPPQRLMDAVCSGGQSRQMRAQPQQYPGYGQSPGYSMRGSQYGSGAMNGVPMGSQYGSGNQQMPGSGYNNGMSGPPAPCGNSMSTRPLVDGQVVRGTIRITVGPKGFMQNNQQQQQQPCPYG